MQKAQTRPFESGSWSSQAVMSKPLGDRESLRGFSKPSHRPGPCWSVWPAWRGSHSVSVLCGSTHSVREKGEAGHVEGVCCVLASLRPRQSQIQGSWHRCVSLSQTPAVPVPASPSEPDGGFPGTGPLHRGGGWLLETRVLEPGFGVWS